MNFSASIVSTSPSIVRTSPNPRSGWGRERGLIA
jgi:hypothetical protein